MPKKKIWRFHTDNLQSMKHFSLDGTFLRISGEKGPIKATLLTIADKAIHKPVIAYLCTGETVKNVKYLLHEFKAAFPSLDWPNVTIVRDFSPILQKSLSEENLKDIDIACEFHRCQLVVKAFKRQLIVDRKLCHQIETQHPQELLKRVKLIEKGLPVAKLNKLPWKSHYLQLIFLEVNRFADCENKGWFEWKIGNIYRSYPKRSPEHQEFVQILKHLLDPKDLSNVSVKKVKKMVIKALEMMISSRIPKPAELKKCWRRYKNTFLKNPAKLDINEQDLLDRYNNRWPIMKTRYDFFVELQTCTNSKNSQDLENYLKNIPEESWMVPEVQACVNTFRNNCNSITRFNHLVEKNEIRPEDRAVRAVEEGWHSILKRHVRNSYGIRNIAHFVRYLEKVEGAKFVIISLFCQEEFT